MNFSNDLINAIIDVVKNEKGIPIPVGIIYKKIQKKFKDKHLVFKCVEHLVENNTLKQLHTKKIVMGYENGPILTETAFEGIIFINAKGDGFVRRSENDQNEVYVNKKNINNAFHGDKVLACYMDKKNDNPNHTCKDGVVLKVIEKTKEFYTGVFIKRNNQYGFIFDDNKHNYKVVLDNIDGLVDGHKILIKIKNVKDSIVYASVSKIIGHKNSVGVDILSIVYDAGLEPEFSDEVIEASKQFKLDITEEEFKKRKDLTHLDIVTIDPETSKDLDDAIYVTKKNEKEYKLYVCIADVAHYVTYNSIVDNDAYKRGTSVYLVNQVIPMLPHNLSNEICSLNPNENRLSMVCEMDIDEFGNFTNIDVYNAVINSKRRFSYDQVNDYFKNITDFSNEKPSIKSMLDTAYQLFVILRNKREKLGYINFEIPEPKIILDDNERIIDIQQKQSGKAQNLIEAFMVAANEAVTLKFKQLKLNSDFIYRIHNKPEEKKIAMFEIEAKKLNFKFDANIKNWQPNTIASWLKNNLDNPNKELINMILLRTMAKARYSVVNEHHFGLAVENYTHFTSPIRRYSDLIVHRLFKMFVLNKDEYTDEIRNATNAKLKDICDQTTKTEIIATNTEREVNSMKFAEYMETKIGEIFSGFVSYITSFGCFVQLDNTIEGLARPENILGDYYEYIENNTIYCGRKTRKILTLGTKVKVRIIGSSKITKKIDFEILEF